VKMGKIGNLHRLGKGVYNPNQKVQVIAIQSAKIEVLC